MAPRANRSKGPHGSRSRCQPEDDGGESDELLLIFCRLRDDQREALILEAASGLSYEEAAEVCDCQIDTFRSRLLDARRAISRMLQGGSLEKTMSCGMPVKMGIRMLSGDAIYAK